MIKTNCVDRKVMSKFEQKWTKTDVFGRREKLTGLLLQHNQFLTNNIFAEKVVEKNKEATDFVKNMEKEMELIVL